MHHSWSMTCIPRKVTLMIKHILHATGSGIDLTILGILLAWEINYIFYSIHAQSGHWYRPN